MIRKLHYVTIDAIDYGDVIKYRVMLVNRNAGDKRWADGQRVVGMWNVDTLAAAAIIAQDAMAAFPNGELPEGNRKKRINFR